MSNLDRTWTTFAIEAEVGHCGVGRIVGVHNELRQEVERLRAEVETYARILGEGSRNGPAAAVRAVADRWAAETKLREVVEAGGRLRHHVQRLMLEARGPAR